MNEPRPIALVVLPDNIPTILKQMDRWLVWQNVEDVDSTTGKIKWDKPPMCWDRTAGSSTDSRKWTTFAKALQSYRTNGLDGIGLALCPGSEENRLIAVDLDDCRIPATGVIEPWALEVIADLNSYTEISPSGEGLHIFVFGELPPEGRRKGKFEVYQSGRYITVTGHRVEGTPGTIEHRPEQILLVHRRFWTPKETASVPADQAADAAPASNASGHSGGTIGTLGPVKWSAPDGPFSDNDLFRYIEAKTDELLTRRWYGDTVVDGKIDHSRADESLLEKMAHYIGGIDEARLDRIFRLSQLNRAKWTERSDYRQRTFDHLRERMKPEDFRRATSSGLGASSQATANPAPPQQPESQPWEPPLSLGTNYARPPFPTDVLPGWLRDFVEAKAQATQTPPDLAANLALAVAGAGIARKARVIIRPGWTEPANLFTVTALPSGDRKSPVFSDVMAPVRQFEQQEQARMALPVADSENWKRYLEERIKKLKGQAARASDPDASDELMKEASTKTKELIQHVVLVKPEFYCDDITPEKLAELIGRQGGRMLQASPEGTAFEIVKGRYSETANFDVYLKGYSGDPLRTGRIGRECNSIDNPALSCAFAVQPDVIAGLAENASMRGRGFLARWLYGCPSSKLGCRVIHPSPVPESVVRAYFYGMVALWRFNTSLVGPQHPPEIVPFSPVADLALASLESWLEPQLAEDEPLTYLAGWGSKLTGAIARLSLILHLAATVGTSTSWEHLISRETVEAAIRLGRDYYLPHAQVAFGIMGGNPYLKDAQRVAARLAEAVATLKTTGGGDPSRKGPALVTRDHTGRLIVSQRNIHANVLGGRFSVEEVGRIIKVLEDHNYLRLLLEGSGKGGGRPPSPRFEVNPT